ncbi:MAG: methionyl-tRNA formyltransferase [Parachlamydiales bacterium]|jgi:methionyl-tRNA formyltransferase
MKKLRIVFFGTPDFAAQTLEYLIAQGLEIAAVVSKPDKAQGRSKEPQPTPVKQVALSHNLLLLQPDKVSAPEPSAQLQSLNADLFVVVAYGEIIKQHLLDMPSLGCINIHASLLPKYRGAAPIQRAIMAGERYSGITIMHMVKQMDAGDIIATEKVEITPEMTYGELAQRLCYVGEKLVVQTIEALARHNASRTVQDHSQATLAPKIELEDSEIHWNLPAQEIHDLVRGTNPEPGAWCKITHKDVIKRLRIFKTRVHEASGVPGSILEWGPKRVIVACKEHSIEIIQLQLEGKKVMQADELTRGMPQSAFHFAMP